MKKTNPFNVQVWCGLRAGYTEHIHDKSIVTKVIEKHCQDGDCVTLTDTTFIYKDGSEPGLVIGWIQYPRFPRSEEDITGRAVQVAAILLKELNQNSITITTPNESIMMEK